MGAAPALRRRSRRALLGGTQQGRREPPVLHVAGPGTDSDPGPDPQPGPDPDPGPDPGPDPDPDAAEPRRAHASGLRVPVGRRPRGR
ncbi:hypothetical protein DEI86_15910 [Curtobacterium sp. MCBD17_028]|nr:hypothetical protein DEI86_15910 [Curtobacterium sp. MCBD17_028]